MSPSEEALSNSAWSDTNLSEYFSATCFETSASFLTSQLNCSHNSVVAVPFKTKGSKIIILMSGKASLISVQKSSSQTTAQSGGVGHVATNVTFSRDNAERLYDGFDSGVEVVNISPISVKGVDLSGAAKLPVEGDEGHEPWPPVGDGLLSLLFFAGIYAFARFRRIKN